jgi:hypothetical protein
VDIASNGDRRAANIVSPIVSNRQQLGTFDQGVDMATTKKPFELIPTGTRVTWHYRSAIGHGTVIGVHKMGTTADNTMYRVRQHDHHPGEPAVVHHTGKALTPTK